MHRRMNAGLNVLQGQSLNSHIQEKVTSNRFHHLQTEILAKHELQMGKRPMLPVPKATMSEEQTSNKMPDAGAMTDGSKRRREAVMSASGSEMALGAIPLSLRPGMHRHFSFALLLDCPALTSGATTGKLI